MILHYRMEVAWLGAAEDIVRHLEPLRTAGVILSFFEIVRSGDNVSVRFSANSKKKVVECLDYFIVYSYEEVSPLELLAEANNDFRLP